MIIIKILPFLVCLRSPLQTFPHCLDPAHLSHILAEDRILIEIIQLNEDYSQDGTVLALYETSMREFLYPEDSLAPSYTDSEREVLMQRTIWFSVSNNTFNHTMAPILCIY